MGLSLLGTQEGQHKRRAKPKGPAPPSFPRLGARVAPQRCPVLRAGDKHFNMEQLDAIMQIIAKEWFNKTIAKPMAWKKVEIKELRHYTHLTSLEKTGFITYSSPRG